MKNGEIFGDTIDISDEGNTERLIESQTGDAEDSELFDYLKKLESNPVDLNSASISELEAIPFLNAVISKKIIEYRTKYRKFNSISELKNVIEIDNDLYREITKFLIVKESKVDFRRDEFGRVERIVLSGNISKFDFRKFDFKMRNRFTNDLQPSRGYLYEIYRGMRPKIYNKLDLRYSSGNLIFNGGIVSEKDAGERKIFDFIGGYVEMKNIGIVNQVLLGDYTLEFGQGITLWSSLAFSKGNDAVSAVKKNAGNINSYSSVNEVQFFRGIASKLNLGTSYGNFNLFGFFSDNYFDASSDSARGELSAFYYDGYHRTESEIRREKAAKEKLFGGRLSYELGSARLGFTYYKSYFSESFTYKSLNKGYDFSGSRTNAMSVDYDFVFQNMNFFGEWSRSYTGAIGGVSAARIIFSSKKFGTDVVFLVRNYPMNFIMLHSYGFGEQSGNTQNEFGIYSGIKFKVPGLVT
ncbi:MAG: ComEA family DNA-binding protein, partial [Ignavibacteria bacterium]